MKPARHAAPTGTLSEIRTAIQVEHAGLKSKADQATLGGDKINLFCSLRSQGVIDTHHDEFSTMSLLGPVQEVHQDHTVHTAGDPDSDSLPWFPEMLNANVLEHTRLQRTDRPIAHHPA